MLESSPSISSIMGSIEGSCSFPIWPFLIIVMGLPICPSLLHLFGSVWLLVVEPNLIEFPNLPSSIVSPS